LSDIYLTVA